VPRSIKHGEILRRQLPNIKNRLNRIGALFRSPSRNPRPRRHDRPRASSVTPRRAPGLCEDVRESNYRTDRSDVIERRQRRVLDLLAQGKVTVERATSYCAQWPPPAPEAAAAGTRRRRTGRSRAGCGLLTKHAKKAKGQGRQTSACRSLSQERDAGSARSSRPGRRSGGREMRDADSTSIFRS